MWVLRTAASVAAIFCVLVQAGQIQVTSPSGGEQYYIGDTVHIRWTGGGGPGVRIWLASEHCQEHWGCNFAISLDTDSTWGDFQWVITDSVSWVNGDTVPLAPAPAESCWIVITEMGNCTGNHDSSGCFTIDTSHAPAGGGRSPHATATTDDAGACGDCGSGSVLALLPALWLEGLRLKRKALPIAKSRRLR